MSAYRIRRRARLKNREAHALREKVSAAVGGIDLWPDGSAVETGSLPEFDVVLVDGVVVALLVEGDPLLSVRGLLQYRPENRFVTVDMGAVRFVHNGADIMAPGIVAADPALDAGDLCWIRDEQNGQPLAVGRSEMPGPAMVSGSKGKAVANVHHIGDKLWVLGEA